MKKKTITITEDQKKILIRAALTTVAVGGSYILLWKFLKSETAYNLEEALIQKLMRYHVETHKLAFHAQYGSYKNMVPKSVYTQINAAISEIIDPILAEVGG